jgi:2-(1,2-epoxy-1,2-dihydrophenyl)acetyl-CoA isomerase
MGAHLALACDLVIAADNAKFVEVFARRGLVPDALGPWLLPRIIGVRKTMELMLFARRPSRRGGRRTRTRQHGRAWHADLEAAAAEWAEQDRRWPDLRVRTHQVAREPEPRRRPADHDAQRGRSPSS